MIALTQEKREELIESAKNIIAHDDWLWERFSDIHASSDTVYLIKIALASLTAKPVAYLSKNDVYSSENHILARNSPIHACTLPVYDEPPVPEIKLPEEVEISSLVSPACDKWHQADGWNMCLAEIKRLNGLGE